jgi:hypothetical protein
MICVIDISRFPSGQFMRDTTLLEAYRPATKGLDSSVSNFFDFRLKNDSFYNGEYLSQGTVNHTGRSCIVTLNQLVEAGLFELYPKLGGLAGNNRWAKRVLDLRSYWSPEHTITEREIEFALKIGRTCFKQFELFDTASILLAFKNRKMQSLTPSGEYCFSVTSLRTVPDSDRLRAKTHMGRETRRGSTVLDYHLQPTP